MPQDPSVAPRVAIVGWPWLPQLTHGSLRFAIRGGEPSWRSPWLVPWEASEDVLGPMFISNFIVPTPITDEECNSLEEQLGQRIEDAARHLIDDAIHQFVATVALKGRLPSWQQLRTRFEKLAKLGSQFLNLCGAECCNNVGTEVLSIDETVATFLGAAIWIDQQRGEFQKALRGIKEVINTCNWGLKTVKRQVRRGQKGDFELRCFLEALVIIAHVAHAEVKLPGSDYKGPEDPKTPFFKFVRQAIVIAVRKGSTALEGSPLSADEKLQAVNRFSRCRKKKDGALVDQLTKVKKTTYVRGRTII